MSKIAQYFVLTFALLLSFSVLAKTEARESARASCKKVHGKCVTKKPAKKAVAKPAKKVVKRKFEGKLGWGTLAGSRAKLAFENRLAYELGLPRFQTLDEIQSAQSKLVRVPDETRTFYIDDHVNRDRRYLQSWSKDYLGQLAADFMSEAGGTADYPKIKVTSMVRDMQYQRGLRSVAQCRSPESCSTHLTGASFDISFNGMSVMQKAWMYRRLIRDRDLGLVVAIHEPFSGCFHIFVIKPDGDENGSVRPAQNHKPQ